MAECGNVKQAVRVMTAQEGITQGELAERMGELKQVLSRTLNKPDHRIAADLLPIAQALGCSLELRFIRPDGSVAACIPYKGSAAEEEQSSRDD